MTPSSAAKAKHLEDANRDASDMKVQMLKGRYAGKAKFSYLQSTSSASESPTDLESEEEAEDEEVAVVSPTIPYEDEKDKCKAVVPLEIAPDAPMDLSLAAVVPMDTAPDAPMDLSLAAQPDASMDITPAAQPAQPIAPIADLDEEPIPSWIIVKEFLDLPKRTVFRTFADGREICTTKLIAGTSGL